MNRLWLTLIAGIFLLPSLQAQTKFVNTRVYATEPNAVFYVDETFVRGSQSFLWPEGSKHRLRYVGLQTSGESNTGGSGGDAQYTLTGWTDDVGAVYGGNDGNGDAFVTAKSSITYFRAEVNVAYLVKIRIAPCTFNDQTQICVPDDPNPPGYIVMDNGQILRVDTNIYLPKGSVHTWQAVPNSGNVFTDWVTPAGRDLAFHISLPVNYPYTLQSHWSPAKRVTFNSDPPSLKVRIDRTPTNTPYTFDFAPNSNHVIGADSPQLDKYGQNWVFTGWSNGMGQDATYTVGRTVNSTDTLTAKFSPAGVVTFQTDPPGLKLSVNGRDNWPSLSFVGAVGSSWDVSAPLEQSDSTGRKYTFAGWSNGGSAAQTVTMQNIDAKQSMVLTAKYVGSGRVTITTNPPGLAVKVDGTECRTPCSLDKSPGTEVELSAPATVSTGDDSRLEFTSWSDGGGNVRTFSFGSSASAVTANYQTAYRVRAFSEPANAGDLNIAPGTADNFYPVNSNVVMTAAARPGFRFRSWTGDMSSQGRILSAKLSGPITVRATFDKVPFVLDNGVKNAAGDTPDAVVAPGSIISIVGASLSATTEAGPVNPMAQTLGGVIVRMEDRILPLYAITPEQINALAPADLPDGTYRVTVSPAGLPQVDATVNVARNAPGLFSRWSGERLVVSAVHADGTPVDFDSPAKRNETIVIFGTGFGPFDKAVPVGFPVPANLEYKLVDTVDVVVNDQIVAPVSVVATPGSIGLTSLKVKIADPVPSGATVNLRVRINGRDSNTVQLPVE